MAACPECGYVNSDGADFCENPDCGAYLRWTRSGPPNDSSPPEISTDPGQPPDGHDDPFVYGSPQPRQRTPPSTPSTSGAYPGTPQPGPATSARPLQEQKKGLTITADPLELRAEPGGPPVSTVVKVCNKGSKVEQFMLTVNGIVAPYAQVDPPQLNIYPGDEQTAQVRFTVPRSPQPGAGRVPFEIAARASVDADVHGRVAGGLTISRFDEISVALEPEMTRGRKPGRHQVIVANSGNAPLNVQVALADQQGELNFDPARFGGPLAPGMTATQDVKVSATVKWFGRTQVYPFTGTVTTDAPAVKAAPLQGKRRQVPRLPWWIPTAALAIIALLLAAYGLLGPTVPDVSNQTAEQARTLLEEKHYRVVLGAASQNPSVPKGNAIKTDPPAGQKKLWFSKVLLTLSLGPCSPEGCLVQVPYVQDYPRQEAEQMLAQAGFVADIEERSDQQRAKGVVISSTPPGGQNFKPGSTVLLVVSSGPAANPTTNPTTPPAAGPTTGPAGGDNSISPKLPLVLPNLAKRPRAQAAEDLTKLGLTVAVRPQHTNEAARDTVLSTEPAAGSQVDAHSSVTLVLAAPTAQDLVDLAPKAIWSEASSTLSTVNPTPPNLTPLNVGTTPDDPVAVLPPETGPNGTPTIPVLSVNPLDTIIGTYMLTEPTIDKDHVRAQVVLQDGADGPVTVDVVANGVTLQGVKAESGLFSGGPQPLDVPLPPGATSIQIKVTGSGTNNWALVKALRIEGNTG